MPRRAAVMVHAAGRARLALHLMMNINMRGNSKHVLCWRAPGRRGSIAPAAAR